MNSDRTGKLITLLSLYVAQSIPMSFFTTVVPVIMRQQHYSLESIGLMQLVKLPWILKFLWAPYVDRTGSSTKGYRRWIYYSEGFYAISIASIAFFRPEDHIMAALFMMVLAITASATQDIATDAWAILTLKKDERSLGNSMQSVGSFAGAFMGSGVLLVVYHYLGWSSLLLALSFFVLLALLPLALYRPLNVKRRRPRSKSVSFRDIGGFFMQKGILPHILFLLVFHSSLTGIMTMVKPYMIDLGYNARDVGIAAGIFGTVMGAVSALGAGFIMRRIRREKAAIIFSVFNLIPVLAFLVFHRLGNQLIVIYPMIALLWAAYAMGMVLLFTTAMDNVRHCREGTDFTIQIVLVHLGSLVMAVSSGRIAEVLSYSGLFGVELFAGIVTVFIVYYRFFITGGPSVESSD